MGVVETDLPAEEKTTPETPSEWFDHNVRGTFHTIIESMTLRSESEKVVLHALVDDLDKDPEEVIAKLEIAPINQGGGGYVDPVLAQVLSDNAALRKDVQELLSALRSNADNATVTAAEDKLDTDLASPETVPAAVTAPAAPTPIQTAPVPTPAPVETPVTEPATTPASPPETAPVPAEEPAPATAPVETTTDLPPAV